MEHFYVLAGTTAAAIISFKLGRKKGCKYPGRYYFAAVAFALIASATLPKVFG